MPRTKAAVHRQQLLSTARAVLAEQGLAELSVREIARRAGVSHQTPYHLFGSREGILAELAAQGFAELTRRLVDEVPPSTRGPERLIAAGRIYVDVARCQPALFRLMFSAEQAALRRHRNAHSAAQQAYQALQQVVASVAPPAAMTPGLVDVAWALAHGVACLVLDGPPAASRDAGRDFAERIWLAWAKLIAPAISRR